MAEGEKAVKGNAFKVLSKKVTRTKEKVLVSMGKADKTKDDAFDEHVVNFNKQQATATKIQAELKKYISCVKTMSNASKSFYDTLRESYEEEFTGHGEVTSSIQDLSVLWDSYTESMTGEIHSQFTDYVARFPDLKNKIAKRGRKLVDYDSSRHALASLENAKKKDEAKISKAQDELSSAKRIYDEMNSELNEELPHFYLSRVSILAQSMHRLLETEAKYMEESAKLKSRMSEITEQLNEEHTVEHKLPLRRPTEPPRPSQRPPDSDDDSDDDDDDAGFKSHDGSYQLSHTPPSQKSDSHTDVPPATRISNGTSSTSEQSIENKMNGGRSEGRSDDNKEGSNHEYLVLVSQSSADRSPTDPEPPVSLTNDATPSDTQSAVTQKQVSQSETSPKEDSQSEASPKNDDQSEEDPQDASQSEDPLDNTEDSSVYSMAKAVDDIYVSPTSNETIGLPEGVLYQVITTHLYTGDDADELSFKAGEIINVYKFEDPDEQDDGWLYGQKTGGDDKGVFPENFTKRI